MEAALGVLLDAMADDPLEAGRDRLVGDGGIRRVLFEDRGHRLAGGVGLEGDAPSIRREARTAILGSVPLCAALAQILGRGAPQDRRAPELSDFFVRVEAAQKRLVEEDLYGFHVDRIGSAPLSTALAPGEAPPAG